jgi:hypothetical protein
MTSQPIIIRNDKTRARALSAVMQAPEGSKITVKEATRSDDQNAKMWAMLHDVSRHKPGGREASPEDWKILAMHMCGHECRFIHGLEGDVVPAGFRSSKLTIKQMVTLITWLYAFGAEYGVVWSEPVPEEYRGAA